MKFMEYCKPFISFETYGFYIGAYQQATILLMTNIQEKKFTPLLPLIQTYFSSTIKRSLLNQFVSDKELVLGVIEKGAVICITDMKHSVQGVKSKVNLDRIHPFSRQVSNYYNVADRSWISFNAKLQDLGQRPQYPHPYQPCFYFKKHYDDYRKQRAQIKLQLQCEVIKVRKWSSRVLNISESGYYGIILELLDFRYTNEKSIQNVSEVTSVLYEPFVKAKLQAVRLDDLRRLYSKIEKPKDAWSLFYYCRNINLNPNAKRKLNNMVVVDKSQNILNYDQERKHHFVNFGVIEEANCLQFPLNSKQIDYGRIKRINIQSMQVLYNRITQPSYAATLKEKNVQGQLWSSDQEESSNPEQKSNQQFSDVINSESESEDAQGDPLRNLYIKQFQNLKIL